MFFPTQSQSAKLFIIIVNLFLFLDYVGLDAGLLYLLSLVLLTFSGSRCSDWRGRAQRSDGRPSCGQRPAAARLVFAVADPHPAGNLLDRVV